MDLDLPRRLGLSVHVRPAWAVTVAPPVVAAAEEVQEVAASPPAEVEGVARPVVPEGVAPPVGGVVTV